MNRQSRNAVEISARGLRLAPRDGLRSFIGTVYLLCAIQHSRALGPTLPNDLLAQRTAAADDIVLLYGDESEALTHPYLARAWAKSDANLRVPAPGQAKNSQCWARLTMSRTN